MACHVRICSIQYSRVCNLFIYLFIVYIYHNYRAVYIATRLLYIYYFFTFYILLLLLFYVIISPNIQSTYSTDIHTYRVGSLTNRHMAGPQENAGANVIYLLKTG